MRSFIIYLLLILGSIVESSFAQTVTIDLSKEYQTIKGFGGMNHTTWIKDLNEDNRKKAFGNNPGQMGLTILRMHIDPNPDNFQLELPTALYAKQTGATLFASPWDAPSALTVKINDTTRVDPTKYNLYVDHLNAFNTFMSTNGAALNAISVQNEPDYGTWTQWRLSEMLNFMKNQAQNINNKVIAPESFQFRRNYTDPLLNDAQAAANLDIVGGHIYGGGLADYPLARDKGKEVWMTEHLLGSGDGHVNDWNLALIFGKEINDCMKANFNAYVWWFIRRFYGLIGDEGNISDKGYVISQFSKFVRPGAVRIDASVTSDANVDVTAYKTDTSLVIVVINQNSTSKILDFNISGGSYAKYTQFATSSTKKMFNDGDLTVTGNSFTATVQANSVTTFTSHPGNGGKQGNTKPVAVAGDDINIDDTEGLGSKIITLDGSNSADADGQIVNYSWSLNGQQVAWNSKPDITITIGGYELVLTVTDNDGATATDTMKVALKSTKSTEIWLEAECGTIGASWKKSADANASNSRYVETTPGIQSTASASNDAKDLLVYNFTTTESGNFKVWGRIITPTANDDSYWVKVDALNWINWNSIPAGTDWHWDDVHDQSNDNVVFYALDAGNHTLSICMREDGAKLDKILIANTGIKPTDFGGQASGCIPTGITFINNKVPPFKVYPNPSAGHVNIEWVHGFDNLNVFNKLGQSVYFNQFSTQTTKTDIDLNLKPGNYYILLQGDKTSAISKIVIE